MRLRVIGVGSPHGDDAVGLAVARRLAREGVPEDVEVVVRSRPGIDLLEDLGAVDAVVLVDAVCGEAPPGAILRVEPGQLEAQRGGSHGFGVAAALSLAAALGVCPAQVRIVGIAIGRGETQQASTSLSHAVRAAITPACERVREQLRELAS